MPCEVGNEILLKVACSQLHELNVPFERRFWQYHKNKVRFPNKLLSVEELRAIAASILDEKGMYEQASWSRAAF